MEQREIGCMEISYLGMGNMRLPQTGRIGKLGFSAHCNTQNLRTFADHHAWDFGQLQINYFDWVAKSAKEQYEALTHRGIPVIVMEPLRGGKLMNAKSGPSDCIACGACAKRCPQSIDIPAAMASMK